MNGHTCGCSEKKCHHHEKHGHDHGCTCGHEAHDQACGCGHENPEHGCTCGHHHNEHAGRVLLVRAISVAVLLLVSHFIPCTWMKMIAAAAAYLAAGYDVVLTALRNILKGKVFDENFLMTVASIGAMLIGETAEGVMVMMLYQLGEYLQHRAVDQARANIAGLMDVRPEHANVLRQGLSVQVSPELVEAGEYILVRPGERIPLDGEVTEGSSTLDTSALTGESFPRHVAVGDSVLSGCVNLTGVLTIRVTAEYGQSTVAKILDLVAQSDERKARTERFITRFSRWYTPAVCFAAALLAFVPGLVTGEWSRWLHVGLTFLVISCPCALVISVPLTFFAGIGGASRKGVLVKGANHLETLAGINCVAFDKTGTLTKGVFSVTAVVPAGMTQEQLLALAAHAEIHSAHPISRSLRVAYGCDPQEERVTDVEEIAGKGVSARIDGRRILCGSIRLLQENGIVVAEATDAGTIVYVAAEGVCAGHIVISDAVRDGADAAMAALKTAGVTNLVMLTGDHETVAKDVCDRLALTEYHASLLPGDKVTALERLMERGDRVAFVGDGVNDAPVLRRADVGIAMGGLGSDAAVEAADVVLMDDDVGKLAIAIHMARKTAVIVRQNIAFALAVKALVMLLGALGFANMWLAVFADVGVAMLCIVNALRAMK